MSNVIVGLLVGVGLGAWIYNKLYRSTGGNTKNALIVAGVAGGFTFVVVLILLGVVFK